MSIVDFGKIGATESQALRISSGFYSLMFKSHCHKIKYGRSYYDFQEGTLICIAPQQVISLEPDEESSGDSEGWGVFFHPDFLRDTPLGVRMKDYSFFSYEINEALHLSDKEKRVLKECGK